MPAPAPPAPTPVPANAVDPAPPHARREPRRVDSPNGARADDYYWLRDDTRESPEVLQYLESENRYAESVLAPHAELERQLFDELRGRLKPDDASVPVLRRGYWYYSRFVPEREYAVFARRKDASGAARAYSALEPEEVLLDGNAMAQGLAYFQIGDTDISPDGNLIAYTLDDVGRRQYVLHVKDLRTGTVLADRVENVESEVLWAGDNRTILYIEKDPETLLSVRLRAHVLGADPAGDRLVYEEHDHSFYLTIGRSRSEHYIFVCSSSTQQSEWQFTEADDPALRLRCVLARQEDHEYQVEHLGNDFLLRTNRNAPNFRIVRAPIEACADVSQWADVVGHRDDTFIEDFLVSSSWLAINERAGGLLRIRVQAWGSPSESGTSQDIVIASNEPAYAASIAHTPDIDSPWLRYVHTSLVTPRTTYDFDPRARTSERRKSDTVLGGFDAANYRTELFWAQARDGARIPVSLAYRRDTPLDGTAPIYQYGYGAYGFALDPEFRSSWVSLMDRGFVVAIAHVRGGQEMGRAWYDAGRLLHKRNSFADFIDATDALVQARYGARDKVCAQGASAGGLVMGAIANMAPERYRAIVAHVPFVDVVTTMLDESIPLTTNEYDQWGDPRQERYYEYMLSYSPYDNVHAQDYPAMLVFTGLWDSQVQYFEPAKWVARLRERKTDANPLLFCVDMSAGHGGKSGRYRRFQETAREYAFLLWQLGLASK